MPLYKQADLESNRGLKGKSRVVSKKQDRHRKPRSLSFSVPRIVFLPYGTVE
ncbi:hypothetical protein BKA82DRAFT_4338659, partial [Pisolithus tinctorius]